MEMMFVGEVYAWQARNFMVEPAKIFRLFLTAGEKCDEY
jgi:hypothetical protein